MRGGGPTEPPARERSCGCCGERLMKASLIADTGAPRPERLGLGEGLALRGHRGNRSRDARRVAPK